MEAQCNYIWQSSEGERLASNILSNSKITFDSLNLLLSKVVDSVRIIRIDDKSAEWVDSFKAGQISDTSLTSYIGKAFFARGNNEWWYEITCDHIGYLFTQLDTIKFENHDIYIYRLSTNLATFWNIDFNNWVFYYCKEFGIIKYFNDFISEPNFGENYILADKSCSHEKQFFKLVIQRYSLFAEQSTTDK